MQDFSPKIMGILNTTLDSFYDKGRFHEIDRAVAQGIKMYEQGADLIDIGGESTRPDATPVPEEEEFLRVIPIIKALKKQIPIPISIDTTKPRIAKAAINEGASLINDVSGFRDPAMIEVAADHNVKICIMHMEGTPQTMQINPHYQDGVVSTILNWFRERVETLISSGVAKHNIIIDPGIGFGKTVDDNLEIIHNLQRFKDLNFPILLGLSRKSFMGKITQKSPSELLPTTIAMNTVALLAHVDIIRVHDVAEHHDVIKVLREFLKIEEVYLT